MNILLTLSSGTLQGYEKNVFYQFEMIKKAININKRINIIGTTYEVVEELNYLIQSDLKISNLFVYVNTHGIHENNNEFLLFKNDTRLSDTLFTDLISKLKAERVVLFLETCFSGGIYDSLPNVEPLNLNLMVFATSSSSQPSFQTPLLGGLASRTLYRYFWDVYLKSPSKAVEFLNSRFDSKQTASIIGNSDSSFWFL